jgi:hypothetical protein
MEMGTHNRASKGSPYVTGSDADRADGQKTELTFQLLLMARSIEHLAHTDGIVLNLKMRFLILVAAHIQ